MENLSNESNLWDSFEQVEKRQEIDVDENGLDETRKQIERQTEALRWGSNPIPPDWVQKYSTELPRQKFVASLILISILIFLSGIVIYQYYAYQYSLIIQISNKFGITEDLRQNNSTYVYGRIILQTVTLLIELNVIFFAWIKRKKVTEWNYFKHSLSGFFIPLAYLLFLNYVINFTVNPPPGRYYALPIEILRTPVDIFVLSTSLYILCPFIIILVILAKSCIRIDRNAAIYLYLGWFLRITQTGKRLNAKSKGLIHLLASSYLLTLKSLQKGLQKEFDLDLPKLNEIKSHILKKLLITSDILDILTKNINSIVITNFYYQAKADLIGVTTILNIITPEIEFHDYTWQARARKFLLFAGKICGFILFSVVPSIPAYFPLSLL